MHQTSGLSKSQKPEIRFVRILNIGPDIRLFFTYKQLTFLYKKNLKKIHFYTFHTLFLFFVITTFNNCTFEFSTRRKFLTSDCEESAPYLAGNPVFSIICYPACHIRNPVGYRASRISSASLILILNMRISFFKPR